MDSKALAKSKRAHSLHQKKKHHPHQAPKAPSIGSDDKKTTRKEANERTPQSHGRRPLPSNWGRYDEDLDLSSEEAQASSSQLTEFVVPKSKGADYAHLISEAKAESRARYSSDVLPLFDEFINDFVQDFAPMLAAKGQSILSWVADDSFEFDDKASTSIEAPFLSLNLNNLAGQLAKAKMSERLYLEPDLLPLELLDDELREEKYDPQTFTSTDETNTGAPSLGYNQEVSKNVQQHYDPASCTTRDFPVPEGQLKPVKQNTDEIQQSQETDRIISQKSVSGTLANSTPGNHPTFEAASAEAELDMLLSSFTETKIFESSGARSVGLPSIAAASGETVKKGTTNIDNDIDSLLEEMSDLTKQDDRRVPHGLKTTTDSISSTVHPSSKSKLLDDFDSWLDTI